MIQACRPGYIGVDLFFVLSGFLITRILVRERAASGTIRFSNFYSRRALRIFPIYYLSVALVTVAFPTAPGARASLLLYVFNYYHLLHPASYPLEQTWSLSIEEQFYLIWPFVLAVIPLPWGTRVTGVVVPALAMLCALIFAAGFEPELGAALIYNALPTRMLSLSLGAYVAFRELEARPLGKRACLSFAVAGLAMLASDSVLRGIGVLHAGGWYWVIALPGYGLAGLGAVSYLAASPAEWLRATLSLPPLRYVGRISYGLYLYHVPILFALGINEAQLDGAGTTLTRFLLAATPSFAVTAFSYAALERPLLSLKSRLGRAKHRAAVTALS